MTWIRCFWAHSCQSVLNNENRKLVCVESLCYCGVTRHNKTEALLYVGWTARRRKGYLRTDYTSTTPRPWTALRCGELAMICEEPPASLRLQGYISVFTLYPNICFLYLGLGLWREHGCRNRNFRVALGASWSCVSNVQGSRASSFCCANREVEGE